MNLFLACSNKNWPSSRIRAWNIADHWDQATCYLYQDAVHLDLNEYSNIILQKVYTPEALELAKCYSVYLDLNDPDWWDLKIKANIKKYLPWIKGVVTSSEGLMKDFTHTFGVTPIWIDDRFPSKIKIREHQETIPIIVWFGSTGNRVPCLNPIGLTLKRLVDDGIKFKFLIIDGEPGTKYIDVPWCYHATWNRNTIHDLLCSCDIALLPQYPGPWGIVKSNNKKATAFWAGLPVHDGLEYFSLKDLLIKPKLRAKIGKINRETAESKYNIKTSIEQWKELLND